jgi:hypothetical protein
MHFNRLALQDAHQFGCLIRSDSTGDADDDSHASIVVQGKVNRGQGGGKKESVPDIEDELELHPL